MSAVQALFPRQTSSSPDPDLSKGEQVLQLVANPFQASLQTNAFWASLATSLGISAGLALLFCLIRPRNNVVYAPRLKNADKDHAPPPLGKGLFSWVAPVRKASEPYLMEKIGMDAVVFLRFTRMLRNMFLVLAIVGICVMIPVNVTQGNKAITQGQSAFAIMTPLFIFGGGLWAQVVVAWLIDLVVIYFLWHNYRRIHHLRRVYLESPEYQRSLHARTILIRDIPANLRNNEGIARITDDINPTGTVPKTTVGRNVKVLPELIEEHEKAVRELESILAKYLKNPDRLPPNRPTMKAPSKYRGQTTNGKVDAIEYLTDRIRSLEMEIDDIRERVDNRDAMPYGFASWEQVSEAHTVAFQARSKRPHGTKIRLAPRPNDLIWDNLKLSRASRKSKRFMNGIWIAVLTIIWTPINAGISIFLSNLSNLGSVWPAFQTQLEAHRTGWAIVQGIAAPALTSLVYLLLPSIFRRLQVRAGDVTKTDRERHVLRNLYAFFTLNNLIVFSMFSAVWQYVTIVIQYNKQSNDLWTALRKGQFFLVITTTLCQISPFWVTWILQRTLGAATDLAQLWQLFYTWFARTFLAPTPRQNIEWTAPPSFDYASYYNYFLFYTTVALCYSTLQPIVLVVTALYFVIDAFLKKYLLMYVFITKTESGGQFWTTMFNRIVFATILSNVVIGIVVKARGEWTLVAAIAPLLVIMLAFKWYCMKTFDLDLKYYSRGGMHDQERLATDGKPREPEKVSSKFGHPALYQPLMTPMVHAKAKHVLAEIYRGRLQSDGGQSMAFSDIAMQPMTQTSKLPQDVPFEFVPEAQQDFQFYKNREDFREGAGDDMLSSSRSQTPASSFVGQKESSPSSSRGTSPAPQAIQHQTHIHRKDLDQSNVPSQFRHGAPAPFDGHTSGGLEPRHGPYTDPYDDRANLLGSAGDVRTPNGEFMSVDRWRTPVVSRDGSEADGYQDTTPGEELNTSYDYFRGRR
ncbi:uncharacterized protein Z520_00148 [Fonsecaea multimorphosa CBS 102226]|uniref:CSC1/OSCA1-like 7TM region domain-containing protein n=1 Tax=Fonsecaea multimorphosa CBS 102226 TaxID=1442371 RepID=A0A0D2J268_9EURO|nr:uncharacterized protein Z520_00148 [Fonsecaea multimorphosa CBS 102226]KIY03457.1 hypothetical protein Z520_00148 [Fonsecaea multimorphosa CBS 102226]OAL32715.1 hypothetical protein AYO22_00189 [Fonsecaea multimorphosa]